PMNEDGSETLYSFEVKEPIVNFGVSVVSESARALIDPFVLGSKDENDVEGYAGIPTDVNSLTYDSGLDVGAAGVQFPRLQRFYVAVDSRADEFTNRSQKGKYVLRTWVDDLVGPQVRILTTRVTAGRPLIAAEVVDSQSGVDPLSLVINYSGALVGASAYDPVSGLVLFGIPTNAPAFKAGKRTLTLQASDYQEAKNINTVGDAIYPNSTFADKKITVVKGPTVSWLSPPASVCALKTEQLVVTGGATRKIRRVEFTLDGKRLGVDKKGAAGIYSLAWKTGKVAKGKHVLAARLTDASGKTASSARKIRVCK
ncbi:MAG TPA: Ig-like domain-containing protein, partial [Gaiellaceae bacterium]|nr:Ig-like domain-containing protein [Gaiellaceae bacterium]